MGKGRSPEFLEINRPTSQKASSWLSKAIADLFFLCENVQIKHTKEAVRSESSFLLNAFLNVAKKWDKPIFLQKQHILVKLV